MGCGGRMGKWSPTRTLCNMKTKPQHLVEIPEWDDAQESHLAGNSNEIAEFVFHNEPAGNKDSEQWRKQLHDALDLAYLNGLRAGKRAFSL